MGVSLAAEGKKVLLVDADPQGSLTISMGWQQPDELPTTLSTLMQKAMNDQPIQPGEGILHHAEGVDLIPANIELAGLEVALVNSMNREKMLKQVLDGAKREYDYILLDCTPSLGMLTINALAAADTALIPVQAQYLSAKGLEQLLQTVGKVRRQINPKLKIEGILLTMTDSRTNYGKQIDSLIRQAYGSKIKVFGQTIPRSVRAAETSAAGKSIFQHDPKGKVAEAYHSLAKEVLADAEKRLKRSSERARCKTAAGFFRSNGCFPERTISFASHSDTAARSSVLNAHYTSPTVIHAIYDAVEQMGFKSGNILEPSMGVGNFFGILPDTMQDSRLYGVELDSITGRIAKKLYSQADITAAGFETTDRRDFYDLAVGNVPFGQYKVNDKAYNKLGFSIHNYFFAKAIDQVRPGGIVAFVTSRYTMDSKDSTARKHIAERADLLSAIRLLNNAFKANAGTEVVSDIIFLQKRDRPADIEPPWVQLGKTEDGFAINQYFIGHPEMVLGELTTESTQYGHDLTVAPIEGAVLSDQLAEAVQHIEGQYTEVEVETPDDEETAGKVLPADPDVKNFSYAVVDGEVYYRENSIMTQIKLSDAAKALVTGMVELRQIVNRLIQEQLDDYPDSAVQETQARLNAAYDAFTAKHGLINDRRNARLFEQDSSYYLLCSLENLDENKQLKSKADMFTKRTIRPERVITSVDTPSEALAVSMGEHGRVDLPYMAELLSTPGEYERITTELSGVIFKDPSADPTDPEAGWQMADEYLSGDVRTKLRIAQLAAETNPEFKVNVTALEKAQPKELEASEIDVRLGATWIAPEIIQKFMQETFQVPYYLRRDVNVRFSPYTAEWRVQGKSALGHGDIMSTERTVPMRTRFWKIRLISRMSASMTPSRMPRANQNVC